MTGLIESDAVRRRREIYKVTLVGSVGNLLLVIFKFVAGFLGHSSAMIADAVHSLSDFITDIIVLVFVKISSKPSDEGHDFGHGKYETLATALIALMLFAVGIGLFWGGAKDIYSSLVLGNELGRPGSIALWAAGVSILIKEGLFRYTIFMGRKLKSKVVEANAWHHRSDAFSSIATAIGIAGAMFLGAKWRVLDPIAAVVVSVMIVKVAYTLFTPCLDELLERSLPHDTEKQIIDCILSTDGARAPHNLRTRRIGNYSAVDVHVRMAADMTVAKSHEITRLIEKKIRALLGPDTFIYIHVEPDR